MWSINGAMALWLGYWVFVVFVVIGYEKRNRALAKENLSLKQENSRLKKQVYGAGSRSAKRAENVGSGTVSKANSGRSAGDIWPELEKKKN